MEVMGSTFTVLPAMSILVVIYPPFCFLELIFCP
jgi:hypothetical protein